MTMHNKEKKHVIVLVLGDLGRSPHMNYHALSLLELGHQVSLIGYDGEDVIPELRKYDKTSLQEIRFTPYLPSPVLRKILPIYNILRLLGLIFGVAMALKRIDGDPDLDCILVHNPPSPPLMPIAHLYPLTWRGITKPTHFAVKLSVLLKEFPEIALIIDFKNLQTNVETAILKYAEEKEAKKHKAQLLMNYGQEISPLYSLPDEVLSKCLSFVGKGHYGSVALVSKKLNESYKKEFGQETAYLEMATSVNLANHCIKNLCKSLKERDEILKAAAVNV